MMKSTSMKFLPYLPNLTTCIKFFFQNWQSSCVWKLKPAIPTILRLGQKDYLMIKANQGYTATTRPSQATEGDSHL